MKVLELLLINAYSFITKSNSLYKQKITQKINDISYIIILYTHKLKYNNHRNTNNNKENPNI
jgi:hypothetical protein